MIFLKSMLVVGCLFGLVVSSVFAAEPVAQEKTEQEQKSPVDPSVWLSTKSGAWFVAVGPYAGYRFMTDGQGNFSLTLAVLREEGKQYLPNVFGTIRPYGFGTVILNAWVDGKPFALRLEAKKMSASDFVADGVDAYGVRFPFSTLSPQTP